MDFCCCFSTSPIICDVLLIICDLYLHHFDGCSGNSFKQEGDYVKNGFFFFFGFLWGKLPAGGIKTFLSQLLWKLCCVHVHAWQEQGVEHAHTALDNDWGEGWKCERETSISL